MLIGGIEMKLGFIPRSREHGKKFEKDSMLFAQIKEEIGKISNVDFVDPLQEEIDLRYMNKPCDLICSMSRDRQVLEILRVLEEMGTIVINSTRSLFLTLNKCMLLLKLQKNGIPVPKTFLVPNGHTTMDPPLVIKFPFEHEKKTTSVKFINSKKDFESNNQHILCQKFVSNCNSLKCYVVGEKSFVASSQLNEWINDNEINFDISDISALEAISIECGNIFGLEIYNVEFMKLENTYYVIDVNDFPSFDCINQAPKIITNYIIRRYCREVLL